MTEYVKKCANCKVVKPATEYYSNKNRSDLLDSYCKQCRCDIANEYHARKQKKCNKCGKIKKFEEFSKNRMSKDGLQHICKECRKQQHYDNYAGKVATAKFSHVGRNPGKRKLFKPATREQIQKHTERFLAEGRKIRVETPMRQNERLSLDEFLDEFDYMEIT